MTIPMQPMAPQGWQCPICLTVHAPYMPTCTRCSPVVVTRLANVTVTDPPAADREAPDEECHPSRWCVDCQRFHPPVSDEQEKP